MDYTEAEGHEVCPRYPYKGASLVRGKKPEKGSTFT